jgi:hypothetical protein
MTNEFSGAMGIFGKRKGKLGLGVSVNIREKYNYISYAP